MREPIIQANQSLVLNGDFTQAFSQWAKGPLNPDWLGVDAEMYEGQMTRFLGAGNESSVRQDIIVPKNLDAKARYFLSFLCETRHSEAGLLRISIDGSPDDMLDIRLLPGKQRDPEQDQRRLADGQPLEFLPTPYNVELQLPLKSQEKIQVSVFSPKNDPQDYVSKICITRIKLHLHLEPAVMQTLMLDEEPVPPSGPLHLCLGASASLAHRLKFEPEPDNAWLGTQASITSDNNPDEAIVVTPAWGVDHPLEDHWLLDCPWIGEQEPYLFSLKLLNQYTADAYPVNVSLGHHRLVFRDVLEAAYYPVLEYDQSVRLGVKVVSYYTGQSLSGRTVTWTLAGQQVEGIAVTNEEGWAYFDYQPTQAGDFLIKASVESRYYAAGVVTETLAVRVLATDPWKEVRAVVDGIEARWEEKTGYPNRGTAYPLDVKLPAGSPLLGTELALYWSGDSHEQLGVAVSPALEFPVPVPGVETGWVLRSEDRLDGRFELSLVCSKLLLPSPKKRMSLARNLVRVGEVREANKFPVVDENESVLLRLQVVHQLVSGDGDPVVNALIDWITPEGRVATRSGVGGWASVLYTPKHAGDLVVTASIKAHVDAVAFERPFNVKALATSPWKNEVRILLDGVEVDRATLGVLCRRGETHTLKVVPVSGSPWVSKAVSLHWRGAAPDIGLEPSDLGTPKPLLAAGVEWKLLSQVNSSTSSLFELELRLDGVSAVRELSGRLLSVDLTEEMSLVLDQIRAQLDGQTLYPCLGALHRFIVLPHALSPLVGLMASLTWSGTPADQLGATVKPALNLPQPLSDAGALWELDFTASQQSGQFGLALTLPQLAFVASANPMMLAHNKVRIEAVRESPVDPVVGQDPAWLWVRVFSHFTGQAVDQIAVTWLASQNPSVVNTDADGWSGFAFAPAAAHPEHQVEALVTSPYDNYQEQSVMTVTALASDPWAELMVSFDGQPPQPWGQKTCFPRRKGEHSIDLEAPSNSPLFGGDLTLGMTGTGPDELGISFLSPGLGVPRPFYDIGLQYLFKVGDLKDGSFALRLSSQRLASLSPANAMSLGDGSQVLKITGSSSVYQTLDWGQELVEKVIVVSAISGRPMVGWTVTWRNPDLGVVTSQTDFYGVASIRFTPLTPGEAELTATVGDEEYSRSVALSYFLKEPREIQSLSSPKPSGHLGELVSAVVTVVSARTGEPLQDVEVMWDYPDRTIAPTRTDAEGNARVEFRMPGIRRGLLQATVPGGYAGWEVKHMEFELVPNRSSSSRSSPSSTWLQEFTLYVNAQRVKWPDVKLNLVEGERCTLMLDYEYSWLIGEPDAFLVLEYKPGAEGQGLIFDPPLGEPVEMAKGTTSLSWSISTDQAPSGPFVLQFGIPRIEDMPKSPPLPGEIFNLAQELEVKFDEFPVTFGESAYPCHGATHTLTLKPQGSLLDKQVKLRWTGGAELGVVVTPSIEDTQLLGPCGVTWTFDCRNTRTDGDFSLELMLMEVGVASAPLRMSLGHNLVRAEHWTSGPYHEGWPDWTEYYKGHIRAISVHLNSVAPNVRVTMGNGATGLTNSKGEYESRYGLKIINQYDQSIV
jgi:hypothetical protein